MESVRSGGRSHCSIDAEICKEDMISTEYGEDTEICEEDVTSTQFGEDTEICEDNVISMESDQV